MSPPPETRPKGQTSETEDARPADSGAELPFSKRIERISKAPPAPTKLSHFITGPPPPVVPNAKPLSLSEEIAKISDDEEASKGQPPPRRHTMEVRMEWLDVKDEPKVVPPNAEAIAKAVTVDFGDEEPPTALRKKPPRVPGANRTLPPMPLNNTPTKPPPPPRRMTQEVEMSWVELVDDDLVEEPPSNPTLEKPEDVASSPSLPSVDIDLSSGKLPSSPSLPKLFDEGEPREVTRVEDAPTSSQRILAEKAVVLAESRAGDSQEQTSLEGPPISDSVREDRRKDSVETAKRPAVDEAQLAEAARKERLSQFLQATSASIPPGAVRVSDLASEAPSAASNEAELDQMREDALAARKREQDARDREILSQRRAERARERLEEEAKQARREQEKREEDERSAAAAMRTGTQDKALLDLSGIDDEIDDALDAILGPNLSYPPPPLAAADDDEK